MDKANRNHETLDKPYVSHQDEAIQSFIKMSELNQIDAIKRLIHVLKRPNMVF